MQREPLTLYLQALRLTDGQTAKLHGMIAESLKNRLKRRRRGWRRGPGWDRAARGKRLPRWACRREGFRRDGAWPLGVGTCRGQEQSAEENCGDLPGGERKRGTEQQPSFAEREPLYAAGARGGGAGGGQGQ